MRSVNVLKQWILLLVLVGLPLVGFCDDPFKMGVVTPEELRMTSFAPDTSAGAVVLYDVGESSFLFTKGTQLQFKRITRIKILKKTGLDQADIVIPYYKKGDGSKEQILSLKGFTYNLEDGKTVKVKLEETAVFDEKLDANWYLKKITMPGVKVGSVIELSYTIKSDFLHLLREWEFQRAIPVKWSEYRVGMVPFFEYKQVMTGVRPFHIKDTKVVHKTAAIVWENELDGGRGLKTEQRGSISMQVVEYRWVQKDVPAFVEEPYLANAADYMTKLEFELSKVQYPNSEPKYVSGDWKSFTQELLKDEDFGGQLTNTEKIKRFPEGLLAGKTDTLEKVKAVLGYVKSQMRWNGKSRLYSENLRKAQDARSGTSADVNLLLTVLLREAGVRANPMLVSTRDHGKPLEGSPMISKFNYVISHVSVGGKNYLLDATEADLPFGMLPMRCLNEKGWVVQAPAGKWLPLTGIERNVQLVSGTLSIKPTGEVTGTLTEKFQGVPALQARSAVMAKGSETYIKEFTNAGSEWVRQQVKFQNLDNLQESFAKEYQLNRAGESQPASLLYVSPMLTHSIVENPFKLAERQYPIDFATPIDETYLFTYKLPEGYAIEELPQGMNLSLPGNAAKFTYLVQVVEGNIQVMSRLNINKTVFAPEEYSNLRELYSRLVAKQAEKIVLKKKS